MYLVSPLAQAHRCLTIAVGQDALHQFRQLCGKMGEETMLFQQFYATPHRAGMTLDENWTLLRLNHARRGKWPRTHGSDAHGPAGLGIAAQQRVQLGKRKWGPIRPFQAARQTVRFAFIVQNCQGPNRQSTSVSSWRLRGTDREPQVSPKGKAIPNIGMARFIPLSRISSLPPESQRCAYVLRRLPSPRPDRFRPLRCWQR